MRRVVLLLGWLVLVQGCFLSRSGTGAVTQDGGLDGGRDAALPPRDSGTCRPSGPDLCNGLDDDCDPSTEDGSGDARFGTPCDDPVDQDLCRDGTIQCLSGVLGCAGDDGNQDDEVELCDGIDNDCNPDTEDGSGDPRVGEACDDPDDEDLCPDGLGVCKDGAFLCEAAAVIDTTELCDGVDNDCDPSTADGSEDPRVDQACDFTDLDLCADGQTRCVGGGLTCANDGGDLPGEVERCDGVDNDCNPATVDGSAETGFGAPCDGDDADRCADGVTACVSGGVGCTDDANSHEETCDGTDQDCDGTVDEGVSCPCSRAGHAGASYLFCEDMDDERNWRDARDYCTSVGYHLATVNGRAEQQFLASTAARNDGYWIGLNDRTTEDAFVWVGDGSAPTYTNWAGTEPNDLGTEDCVESNPATMGSDALGGWNDSSCGTRRPFVCESP